MNIEQLKLVLVGVGGQGTILASDILSDWALRRGLDVKKAEVHGMSQRGGSVTSHVSWGEQVFSPIIPKGQADVLVSFERLEAGRFAEFLKPGGLVVINDYAIEPLSVQSGSVYPSNDALQKVLGQFTDRIVWAPALTLAEQLGNAKAANVVLLGALIRKLGIPLEEVRGILEFRVPPKHLELNKKALEAGFNAVN